MRCVLISGDRLVIDTTDFSKVDLKGIAEQVRELLKAS